jgi:(p)ppGpp synthase/HD superfamily hydrolase
MLAMETETEMIVAVLHDVIEDGGITIDDLRKARYSGEIVNAIDHLTQRDGEEHDQFIDRVKSNPLARRVKIADVQPWQIHGTQEQGLQLENRPCSRIGP